MEGYYTPPNNNNNAAQGLAIAGLILGILSAAVSFIPCLGLFSFLPGIIGIIVSVLSLVQASNVNAPRGIAIAGLVCSILGCCIAGAQIWFFREATTKMQQTYQEFEQQGGFDSLGRRIMTLEAVADSLQKEYNEER